MRKLELHWQILIAIGLAIAAGLATGTTGGIGDFTFVQAYDFVGTLFLNGLLMVVVPLVFSSIVVGIASVGGGSDLGRLGLKTMACYALFTTSAILVGLFYVTVMKPGYIDGAPAGAQLNLPISAAQEATLDSIGERSGADIFGIFIRMIPTNVVDAASTNDVMPLIFFGILFGFFMMRLPEPQATTMLTFWKGVNDTMMLITMWVMKWAPIGVFGLIAETMAITGFEALQSMLMFFLTVAFALLTHIFIVLSVYLRVLGKASPLKHLKAMSPALLMAFSSASSNASLPLNMECLHKRAGVSERVTNFVLPLGATLNMDGTALYECVAAMFLAQAYGLELTFATQFTVVLLALLTSVGMAGIPAASMVAITVILGAIGLPIEALGLLFVTDRILDMLRTSVNVYSDSCGAVIIARTEGEKGLLV
ncbi:MAG TPA: dicarboxylate/amino acid:cation symporter [Pseudomonadales bacterium]